MKTTINVKFDAEYFMVKFSKCLQTKKKTRSLEQIHLLHILSDLFGKYLHCLMPKCQPTSIHIYDENI